jgi:hypothetical protein
MSGYVGVTEPVRKGRYIEMAENDRMERNENPSDSFDSGIREGELRSAVDSESSGLPPFSLLASFKHEASARRRRKAQTYFWISLFFFAATIIGAILRFREISTWGAGGEAGFVVLGHLGLLWLLALVGLALSLIFSAIAIPDFKWAIILFILELLPFLLLLWAGFGGVTVGTPH